MNTILYYLHDPMCSWCWGFSKTWQKLQENLPPFVTVEYVAGGLAPDSDMPMPMAQQEMIQNHWLTIEQKLGTSFNHDFWLNNIPRRSTYNACRAAIAAHKQGCQKEMIDAIQRAYYLRALNPSDMDVLIELAKEQSQHLEYSVDMAKFISDINSQSVDDELHRQVILSRDLSTQGFPSLVIEHNGIRQPIAIDYSDYQSILTDISSKTQ